MKQKLHLLFIIVSLSVFSQNTIGTISATPDVYDGFTLFSTHTKAFLINNCGQVINSWESTHLPGNAVYLLPNGNLLRTGRFIQSSNPVSVPGSGGIIELFDWDGNIIWSWIDSSDQSRLHHDVFPLPNGNILALSATVLTQAEAIQAGRNPNLLVDSELYNERIYEIEPIGINDPNQNYSGNIVWEWNVIDHVIQDFDNTKDNFGIVADNPGKIDINFLNNGLLNTNGDPVWHAENNWLHINAIQYDDEFDQIIMSSRRLSEIWVIDHNTTTAEASGLAGDFLYRWGNPQAYDQGTEADRQLYGQHTPYYIPSGFPNERKIMIFNNGLHRQPLYSNVIIIDPPVDSNGEYNYTPNTAFSPSSVDFSFPGTVPSSDSDFYSAIVSSGRQLPNGNILICEGREGFFFEIDENDNIVWEYASPISNSDGTVYDQGDGIPPNNFAFRATKYSTDYPAFSGRDLTPGDPIENNPNISDCLNTLSNQSFDLSKISLYPNPVKDIVNIKTNLNIDKVKLYTVLGKQILTLNGNIDKIDLSKQNTGIYFVKLYSRNMVSTKKIIKE